jgi:ATP/maltotriose-dependent transcriptional regulator MalT
VVVGIELAATAVPVFLAMSLLPECHRWSERALLALDERHHGGSEEMYLQASLGLSLMYIRGHSGAASAALNRSVGIAKARGDRLNEVRLLGPSFFYHYRNGEFKVCLEYAKRSSEIASTLGDAAATALAHALLGTSLSITGDLSGARLELDTALKVGTDLPASRTIYFGFDYWSWVRLARIRVLYLQGYPAQARAAIKEAFRDSEAIQHPMSLATVISSAATLLWIGDLSSAEEHLDWFISRAQSESFQPYLHLGYAFKGELAICRGEVKAGVEILRSQLERLHATSYKLYTTRLQSVLARGLAATGRWAEALALMDETARLIEEKGNTSYLPELLRLKGSILLAMPEHRVEDAEKCFMESLRLSRSHGSRAWELRTATDLAAHWTGQKRAEDARALLRPVFEQFTEGLDMPDLKAAKSLLTTVGSRGR